MIFIGIIELPRVDDLDFGFIFILFSENWFDADDINKSLREKKSLWHQSPMWLTLTLVCYSKYLY